MSFKHNYNLGTYVEEVIKLGKLFITDAGNAGQRKRGSPRSPLVFLIRYFFLFNKYGFHIGKNSAPESLFMKEITYSFSSTFVLKYKLLQNKHVHKTWGGGHLIYISVLFATSEKPRRTMNYTLSLSLLQTLFDYLEISSTIATSWPS